MRPTCRLALIYLALVPSGALAAEPVEVTLSRVGKWEVNYDQDACHLLAKFGEGEQTTLIRVTRYKQGDLFDLTLYGRLFKSVRATMTVSVDFGLSPPPADQVALVGNIGEEMPLLLLSSLRLVGWAQGAEEQPPPVTPEQEAQANSITVTLRSKARRYRLQAGSLGTPMRALSTCVDDLVRSWGFDPAEQSGLSRPVLPVGPRAGWLSPDDYPQDARTLGENGMVQVRLDIDESGTVVGCRVLFRTNPDKFADTTCELLRKRARFQPALDRDGRPVRSYYFHKVIWRTG